MEKFSVQSLSALLTYFEQQEDTVLWIRSKDYQRQLYLSTNIEKIWGAKHESMYEDHGLDLWFEFLHELDRKPVESQICTRIMDPEQAGSLTLFRIVNPATGVKFVSDYVFLLTGEDSTPIGYAGLAKIITENEWDKIVERRQLTESREKQVRLKNEIMTILSQELGLSHPPSPAKIAPDPSQLFKETSAGKMLWMKNKQAILLTQREAECLTCLAAGKTAKQTAITLKVSPRTVVFHLDNIRTKAQCRTKIELLSKLNLLNL